MCIGGITIRERLEAGLYNQRWPYEIARVVYIDGTVDYQVEIWPPLNESSGDEDDAEPIVRETYMLLKWAKADLSRLVVSCTTKGDNTP